MSCAGKPFSTQLRINLGHECSAEAGECGAESRSAVRNSRISAALWALLME